MTTRTSAAAALLGIAWALVGCTTLAPDVHVVDRDKYPLTWREVREIERLLPALGIRRPIHSITMEGPNRASVDCLTRPLTLDRNNNEAVYFKVVRRNGRWVPVGKPEKAPFVFTA